jgi:DNA-binding NtrC family response regulator
MGVFSSRERHFLSAVANIAYSNPFLPERIVFEKEALGREFKGAGPIWSASVDDPEATPPNVTAIYAKLGDAVEIAHKKLAASVDLDREELRIYEESVHYLLYQRYYRDFIGSNCKCSFYRRFLEDWTRLCRLPGKSFESILNPAHVFACFRQIQRAFHHIYNNIIGNSMPAARLRASVWQSIFTLDMRRYRRTMYKRMGDFPTLITGPSGTGKELIARAIAGSRYVPFEPDRMEFVDPRTESFIAINVAALSPALVEAELFGHRRGSFTGAISDRKGWLETCPAFGSVFLDELGEMDLSLQVKLLRVLETRRFAAVGDTALREFRGKLIAATNRDLPREIEGGRFREDLYYRLCADLIRTPSMAEQIRDSPGVLRELLQYMTRRTAGEEAIDCLPEVEAWIRGHMPKAYAWPGNYRELEQCVRNIIIRGSYRPAVRSSEPPDEQDWIRRFHEGTIAADELMARFVARVYAETGSYEETARRLSLDRRTVKAKVEEYLRSFSVPRHSKPVQ